MADNVIEVVLSGDSQDLMGDLASLDSKLGAAKRTAAGLGVALDKLSVGPKGSQWSGTFTGLDGATVRVNGALDTVGDKISEVNREARSSGSVFSGAFWGTFAANATMAIANISIGALRSVGDNLMKAAAFETTSIGVASDIGTNLGLSIDSSRDLLENTQGAIAELAAALPGVTADYTEVLNQVAPAVAGLYKGDSTGFQEAVLDITKRLGILSVKSGGDASMAGGAINRAIEGTSGLGELMDIDVFQKNAMFTRAIRDGVTRLGKTSEDWKELTSKQRLDIISEALKYATPDTLLAEFEGTAESIIQGFQTSLFDPMLGAFGSLRRIDAAGGRNALEAFAGLLTAVSNLGTTANEVLARYGLSFDPMLAVIRVLDWLTGVTENIDRFLSSGQGFSEGTFYGLAMSAVDWLTNGINGAINNLNGWLAATDWASVGKAFSEGVWLALGALGYLLYSLDWMAIATLFARLVEASLMSTAGQISLHISKIWETFGSAIRDIMSGIRNMVPQILSLLNPAAAIGGFVGGQVGSRLTEGEAQRGTPKTAPINRPVTNNVSQNRATVYSPTVNVSAQTNANPDEIANVALGRLGQMWGDMQREQLGISPA